ncbi:MAG: antitoxin VbhA family protein [Burkholderia gladioli]
MIDERELAERKQAVANAIATQRLEGLEIDPQTLADLDRVVRGELKPADVLRHLHERVAAGDFRDMLVPAK